MIYYDGIIYKLQRSGGISVLFDELISRFSSDQCFVDNSGAGSVFSRYCDVAVRFPCDLFHSSYYRLPVDKKLKTVTTVHDFTYERYVRGLRRLVHSWQKKRAAFNSDRIICVSESTKNDVIEFYGEGLEGRIVVVHNGVSDVYAEIPSSLIDGQVLFVGARGGYKNFTSVVVALENLKHLNLVCVGGGGFSRFELELLENLIPGRYRHAGFLSNKQLNEEYNRSICLVYPSLYEGFGIPVLEAMRAGCPVVAVNSSSIPEVAGDAAFLLERGGAEEIRQAVETLCVMENRSLYRELGFRQAGKFSWDLTFNKTIAVYEELLGRKLVG